MSRTPFAKAEADSRLRKKNHRDDLFKRLPVDVDVDLAATAALESLEESMWFFARACQKLPIAVIRELLARLDAERSAETTRIFIREVMRQSERPVVDAWASALQALLDLTAYEWGSKQKKAKYAALVKAPGVLSAIQAAVVGGDEVRIDMMGVLATDGGDASMDALAAIFAKSGGVSADQRLRQLKPHAADTPAMRALLSGATTRLQKKAATSPALGFLREVFGFEFRRASIRSSLLSVELGAEREPRYQGSFEIDSTYDHGNWWGVRLYRLDASARSKVTSFGPTGLGRDDLKLGACAPHEVPVWLVAAAKKLRIRWFVSEPRGLRGQKAKAFSDWLYRR